MLNSSIVISPLVLFCFQGRLIKQFGELITFFCQFKSLLAPEPFAILQKIRYTDGSVILDGVNFVGGTLFFDGSMRIRDNQRIDQWDGWQDWRIIDVESRYMEFNAYYVDMIRASMKPGMPTALCTHHVPHVKLNGHEPSHYSFYTGMKDLVHDLPFDPLYNNYLISGHTHRRVIGEVVPGFMGVNVGSDYDQLKSFVLEV